MATGAAVVIGLELSRSASGQWLAVDNLVGEYGEGETPGRAVDDLMRSLRESHALLKERRNYLSPALSCQLTALEGFFNSA